MIQSSGLNAMNFAHSPRVDWDYSATPSSDNLISTAGALFPHLPPSTDCGDAGRATDSDQGLKTDHPCHGHIFSVSIHLAG